MPNPISRSDDPRLKGWYHTIDLGNGLVTRGIYDHRPIVPCWNLPESLVGKSALDIGTFDGFWAFELESRGADRVVALDVGQWEDMDWLPHTRVLMGTKLKSPQSKYFRIAHRMRQSRVEHHIFNVYDLSPDVVGTFDIVICGSLLLHLQNPLLALTRIRSVTREMAYVETTIEAELDDNYPDKPWLQFGHLAEERIPGENCAYWRFSTRTLQDMLIYAGFEETSPQRPYPAPYADDRIAVRHRVVIAYPGTIPPPQVAANPNHNTLSAFQQIQTARETLHSIESQPVEGKFLWVKRIAYRFLHSTLYRLYATQHPTLDILEQLIQSQTGESIAVEQKNAKTERDEKAVRIAYEVFDPHYPYALKKALNRIMADSDIQQGIFSGRCNLNDQPTIFHITDTNLRENVFASTTQSKNRQRQLICALSIALFDEPYAALPQICRHINQQRLRVYIAEAHGVLFEHLRLYVSPPLLRCSEYWGTAYSSGSYTNGIRHEDLQQSSFVDESFDIIITADVMEHIPDAKQAEREIVRILRPGGIYCFTIPLDITAQHDIVCAQLDEQGNIIHLTEPRYDDDPLRPETGSLIYRQFSYNDVHQRFSAMGCHHRGYSFVTKTLGMIGENPPVHIVRKANDR